MKNLKITISTLMLVAVLFTSSCKGPQKTENSSIENQEESTTSSNSENTSSSEDSDTENQEIKEPINKSKKIKLENSKEKKHTIESHHKDGKKHKEENSKIEQKK